MSLNKKQFETINKILNELNLKKNDKIHLSLDLMKIFLNLKIKRMSFLKFSEVILKLIRLRIGKNGLIAVPVFNFDCINTGKFNRIKTPGETGAFGNFLLKKYYKKRSYHPINSFLIFGKNSLRLINHEHENCHGANSIWKYFIKENFKLVTIGHHYVRSFTIVHYLERLSGVKYRFDKLVEIQYINFKGRKKKKFEFFARKLDICKHSTITFKCDKIFFKKKIFKFFKINRLISFNLNLKKASRIILNDLKRKNTTLVSFSNNKNKKHNVLDFSNVIKLEEKYQKLEHQN
tara:strand:+ start:1334 stop:2206 length:873 start_codon:yes stop_codon:yes gene_type:complete